MQLKNPPSQQSGVSLIEVLVALLVLAIGVLGYASLQLAAIRGAETAHMRALGTGVAQDLLERILANPAGDYVGGSLWDSDVETSARPPGWKDCISSSCSANAMSSWDIASVRWHAANILPAGRVSVLPCGSAIDTTCVVISWREHTPDDCLTDSGILADLDAACVVMEVAR